ncbi:MAG: Txe/YoeB family addiction module toxin [Ginsengibacter sp.]
MEEIQKSPFTGIGKPEPLKFDLSGKWSRRITEKDRLVYEIETGFIKVYSLKGDYEY